MKHFLTALAFIASSFSWLAWAEMDYATGKEAVSEPALAPVAVSAPTREVASEQPKVIAPKTYQFPKREYAVIVTEQGYYPDKMFAFEGEKVKFFVTSTIKNPSCFIVKDKGLFLAANMGRITEGELLFEHAGEYDFHCPGHKLQGRFTVLKKSKKETSRAMASTKSKGSKDSNSWMPREE